MQKKARNGELPIPAPLGYVNRRSSEGLPIEIDEERAPLVLEAFGLAAQGSHSLRGVLREVSERGLRSRNGKPLGVSALWYLLNNPFYVGLVKCGEDLVLGKHEAIVGKELFETAHKKLYQRKKLLDKPEYRSFTAKPKAAQ